LRRFWSAFLLGAALLAGCKIEQTPPEFIDHRETPAEEREATRQELQDRLRSMIPALRGGGPGPISAALSPAEEAVVIGPTAGEEIRGPDGVIQAFQTLFARPDVRFEEIFVRVSPRNDVAWFRASLRDSREVTRFSGVFIRFEGQWKLLEGHLSRPPATDPAGDPPPPAEAGTPAGDG